MSLKLYQTLRIFHSWYKLPKFCGNKFKILIAYFKFCRLMELVLTLVMMKYGRSNMAKKSKMSKFLKFQIQTIKY